MAERFELLCVSVQFCHWHWQPVARAHGSVLRIQIHQSRFIFYFLSSLQLTCNVVQQITFAPTELPIDGYFSLRVAEEQFDLYTYSYLRYGKDVGQERLFDMLLAKQQRDAQNRVINPCYWTGVEHSYKVQQYQCILLISIISNACATRSKFA